MRREEHYVGRRAMEMKVQRRRKRGRPNRRWLDKVNYDIKEKGLSADKVYDHGPCYMEAYMTVITFKNEKQEKFKRVPMSEAN